MTRAGLPRTIRPPLVLLLLPLAACSPRGDTEEVEFRVPVTVREVETGTVEDLIVATGTLRAPESAIVRVETGGFLSIARAPSGRRLAEGDRVEAGQVIAEVIGRDVPLESGIAATRKRYESARQVLESRRQLYEEGLVSEEDLREAETRLAEAKLEWERSELKEDRTQIVAPISGVLLTLARDEQNLPAASGQRVERGFVVARVAPTETLIAEVDLVGPDLARVEVGLEARLRHYAWENERFAGRLIPPPGRSRPRSRSTTPRPVPGLAGSVPACSWRSPWWPTAARTCRWCRARRSPSGAARGWSSS